MAKWGCAIGLGFLACCSAPVMAQGRGQGRGTGHLDAAPAGESKAGVNPEHGVRAGLSDSARESRGLGFGKSASEGSSSSSPKKFGLPSWLRGGKKEVEGDKAKLSSTEIPAAARVQQNFDRIEQKRLEQAERLRQMNVQKGQEHLAATADRMQQSAEANFQRQMQHANDSLGAMTQAGLPNGSMTTLPANGTLPPIGTTVVPGDANLSPSLPAAAASSSAPATESASASSANAPAENKNFLKRTSESLKRSFNFKSKK